MNIQDIAKIAGVSASTVSKVMNGKDKDISEETRKKVLRIIDEQQYVPYEKYRDKEGMKNRLIGIILQSDSRENEEVLRGLEEAAKDKGYSVMVSYVSSEKERSTVIKQMYRKKVDGLIIDSKHPGPAEKFENAMVYLVQSRENEKKQSAIFYFKRFKAGLLAAEKLIEEGHKKIVCMTLKGDPAVLDGYRKAMHENNLPIGSMWAYEGGDILEIEQLGVYQCLQEDVTAVICGSWEIACCLCQVLERSGKLIPGGVSVISIGDNKFLETYGNGISAVTFPVKAMCQDAVSCLVDMIENEKEVEIMKEYTPEVVERSSLMPPPMAKAGEKIVVVGSMNMDITIEVSRIPSTGETQIADRVFASPGGKGANQAVGAGKLGGQVYMIGCLGDDIEGRELYNSLKDNHVHIGGVRFEQSLSSGKAYIGLDKEGESTIVVYTGANHTLDISYINQCRDIFDGARYCLLSMEIQNDVVRYIADLCRRSGTEVILKPSAAKELDDEILKDITYLVPNEKELNALAPKDLSLEEKAAYFREKGVKNVIVTLGERGCYLQNDDASVYFPGTGFHAVDTTGGADSFISALAVYLGEGKSLIQAIAFAIYASGITVTRYGVQPALPDRKAMIIYEDEIMARYTQSE